MQIGYIWLFLFCATVICMWYSFCTLFLTPEYFNECLHLKVILLSFNCTVVEGVSVEIHIRISKDLERFNDYNQ